MGEVNPNLMHLEACKRVSVLCPYFFTKFCKSLTFDMHNLEFDMKCDLYKNKPHVKKTLEIEVTCGTRHVIFQKRQTTSQLSC